LQGAQEFFCYEKPDSPLCPPLKKGGNYKELLLKSPIDKGGLRGIWQPANGRNFWQTL
jgi:hypothetical protein